MKFTKVAALLLVGFANGLELKTESKNGKYPDWKAAAEEAKRVVEAKHKSISELVGKMNPPEKTKVQEEVDKVKAELALVVAAADKVTALEKTDYEKAKEPKQKDEVADKAAPLAVTLLEKLLAFETAYKKSTTAYEKQLATKEGHLRILKFLKGKIANLEKDGFLAASILSALALSAVAVGSSFN